MPFPDYSFLIENKPEVQKLNLPGHGPITVSMLRLDQIHPQLSGNKLFKLTEYLDEALKYQNTIFSLGKRTDTSWRVPTKAILTFGGPFSNHLVATAFACMKLKLKSIGIVRGEEQKQSTHTLNACRQFGMEIHFMGRNEYSKFSSGENNDSLKQHFGELVLVPTGGFSKEGAVGAGEILDFIPKETFTHICVSVGTATTLAGLLLKKRDESVLAFPAIKHMEDIYQRLSFLGVSETKKLQVFHEYHFGGFAKKNDDLIGFMNTFYKDHHIPLDFVYTAKMMYGVSDLLQKDHFPPGAHILCIHTGGLQGNVSLEKGKLIF